MISKPFAKEKRKKQKQQHANTYDMPASFFLTMSSFCGNSLSSGRLRAPKSVRRRSLRDSHSL